MLLRRTAVIRVLEFGIARVRRASAGATGATRQGASWAPRLRRPRRRAPSGVRRRSNWTGGPSGPPWSRCSSGQLREPRAKPRTSSSRSREPRRRARGVATAGSGTTARHSAIDSALRRTTRAKGAAREPWRDEIRLSPSPIARRRLPNARRTPTLGSRPWRSYPSDEARTRAAHGTTGSRRASRRRWRPPRSLAADRASHPPSAAHPRRLRPGERTFASPRPPAPYRASGVGRLRTRWKSTQRRRGISGPAETRCSARGFRVIPPPSRRTLITQTRRPPRAWFVTSPTDSWRFRYARSGDSSSGRGGRGVSHACASRSSAS